jgi:50S ribosomal protein L16 3-hydroxylase
MDLALATPLLGGLSPRSFMSRHWQKRPLLVRQAMPIPCLPLSRGQLFALAARDEVESRLVVRSGRRWALHDGPLKRRALPSLQQPAWTLLVQGIDLHVEAAHELLSRFRFVPDARLDDVMVSYATDRGGVGPHFDSYDVFLLQTQGRRRWRIGPVSDTTLRPNLPIKMLRHFEPECEWLLEPGDMLYLPPRWAHDGVAEGECMTCSIGFRAPSRGELARDVVQRLLDDIDTFESDIMYADPRQPACAKPGAMPAALQVFAKDAARRLLYDTALLQRALGEAVSEPKPRVVFDAGAGVGAETDVRLDRRTRMLYDARHVYINGESYRATGRDARLLRKLADQRRLEASEILRLSPQARALFNEWAMAGWLRGAA